jgi:hypothetical protein
MLAISMRARLMTCVVQFLHTEFNGATVGVLREWKQFDTRAVDLNERMR